MSEPHTSELNRDFSYYIYTYIYTHYYYLAYVVPYSLDVAI